MTSSRHGGSFCTTLKVGERNDLVLPSFTLCFFSSTTQRGIAKIPIKHTSIQVSDRVQSFSPFLQRAPSAVRISSFQARRTVGVGGTVLNTHFRDLSNTEIIDYCSAFKNGISRQKVTRRRTTSASGGELLLLLIFLLSFGKNLKISRYVLSRILHGKQIKNRSKNKMADAVG